MSDCARVATASNRGNYGVCFRFSCFSYIIFKTKAIIIIVIIMMVIKFIGTITTIIVIILALTIVTKTNDKNRN